MASSGAWVDFEGHKSTIRFNTVAKLQTIISGWTDQCRVSIPKSGKKQDLIDRMTRMMDDWKEQNHLDTWLRAKAVLEQVRETGQYNPYAMPTELAGGFHPQRTFSAANPHKLNGNLTYLSTGGASSPHLRYDAYAPPRKAAPSSGPSSSPPKPSIRFKSSPFYRIEQPVSSLVECPESTSAMDRRSQGLSFTLTSDQLSKLQPVDSKHQLRLFCTSSVYHVHHHTGFRTEAPCPIEFPPTCEVRVNNVQLNANLKGLKKKPGTAPPPDLGKAVRLSSHMPNRVDMVYVNSQQPVQHKKFYIIVFLVEVTTVEQLVEKLKRGKYKSESEIRAKMAQTAIFDDDIIAGPQKMSLKCPLSYMRVNTPCRSIQCPHAQCFDATSWFSMMEQTTTWLCPVCDKVLVVDELIVDGYFDRILKDTPESAEDVMVEADGEWHTSDALYASAGWRVLHPLTNGINGVRSPSLDRDVDKHIHTSKSSSKEANGPTVQEIISLTDSEDDDEGIVKRELSPTTGYTNSQSRLFDSRGNKSGPRPQPPPPKPHAPTEVIDLTLDTDEEEDDDDDDVPPPPCLPPPPLPPPPLPRPPASPPLPPPLMHKRKEREAGMLDMSPSWKKQRYHVPSDPENFCSYPNRNSGSCDPTPSSYTGGSSSWGSLHISSPPPSHSTYQSHSQPTSLLSNMPVYSQNMNGPYSSFTEPSRSINMSMSHSSLPTSYYDTQYRHPPAPGHH